MTGMGGAGGLGSGAASGLGGGRRTGGAGRGGMSGMMSMSSGSGSGLGGGRTGGLGSGSGMLGGASAEDPTWSQRIYPGLPSYKQRRRIVGNVDWPDPEVYSLPTWDYDAPHPESIEVWYAQETLWVYEALIRVIAETNQDYPDNISKAPVKCVEQMLIGQNAAIEWTTLTTTIGDLTGTSAMSSMMSGSTDYASSSSSGSGSSSGMGGSSMFSLSGTAEEQALTKILLGRYIGDDNKPLMPEDKPPFAEFNRMPVCLKLAMDQRRIPDLLSTCANSAMPIDVKHVRVSPDNNVPFVMPIPVEMKSSGSGAPGGGMGAMDLSGGMSSGDMYGGMSGGPSRNGGRGAAAGVGGMGGSGMGDSMSSGIGIGRSDLSQSEYGPDTIRVEIFGVINIYNEPDKANFATGSAADEADAEAEKILAGDQTSDDDSDDSDGTPADTSNATAITVSDETVNSLGASQQATSGQDTTTTPDTTPASDTTTTPDTTTTGAATPNAGGAATTP